MTTPADPAADRDGADQIFAFDTAIAEDAYVEEALADTTPQEAGTGLLPLPEPLPLPLPLRFNVISGRYVYTRRFNLPPVPVPVPLPGPRPIGAEEVFTQDINAAALYQREEIQLDVDGPFPQMTISGTRSTFLSTAGHWVARVTRVAPGKYEGPIWYRNGTPNAIPHTFVSAQVTGGPLPASRQVSITFSGGGAASFTRSYGFQSRYRRKIEFEYDRVDDAIAVTAVDTHGHPNRPATLPNEALSIETVFRRAGFDATVGTGSGSIPINVAGPDALWTDQEMHDAMQIHWSRFANKPQWAMWVLFARLHVSGTNLGGIMFDSIGPNHRQGTAIFSHAFISTPPAGDANPSAWVARMRFWTAVHEMGHAFNLAHSWQKSLGAPWIALADENEARSFMNYPYFVNGGQEKFFSDFAYRFSDSELLFMRHAPERFVQMGNEAWFSNHGFREAALHSNPDFELNLSTAQPGDRFPYLMPPVIEVALTNRSGRSKMLSGARLSERADFTLIINGERKDPRIWMPYLRHCGEGDDRVLKPGEALYDSVVAGAGRNGWDMAEPGRYCLQAVMQVGGEAVYSNQVMVTVQPPSTREEERLGGDLFTPEVGQVISVNGTRDLDYVRDTLAKATELKDNPVSQLAAVTLATPLAYTYKLLVAAGQTVDKQARQKVETYKADPAAARKLIKQAVANGSGDGLINAMGHTRYLRDAPLVAALTRDDVPNSPEAFSAFSAVEIGAAGAAPAVPLSDGLRALLAAKADGLTQ